MTTRHRSASEQMRQRRASVYAIQFRIQRAQPDGTREVLNGVVGFADTTDSAA